MRAELVDSCRYTPYSDNGDEDSQRRCLWTVGPGVFATGGYKWRKPHLAGDRYSGLYALSDVSDRAGSVAVRMSDQASKSADSDVLDVPERNKPGRIVWHLLKSKYGYPDLLRQKQVKEDCMFYRNEFRSWTVEVSDDPEFLGDLHFGSK